MKVLMFGWEFPPKIYGGLAVASYGITKGLSLQGDVEITFCMPKPTGEEDIYIPCDVLIVAIGQNIETHHFEQAGIPVERGKIVTKSTGAFENLPGVFAGGDCASGPASVIKAIAAAKVVAANIDEYLGYHHEISCDVEIPEAHLDDRTPCGRVNLTEREACERVCDFEAVENCMTEKEAKQEASRCLRCDHFGYGIFKGGRETLW